MNPDLISKLPTHIQLNILSQALYQTKDPSTETSKNSVLQHQPDSVQEKWKINDATHLILSRLASHGYCILDHYLDPCLVSEVRTSVLQLSTRDSFRRAGLGTGITSHLDDSYRSDSILFWKPNQEQEPYHCSPSPLEKLWDQIHHITNHTYDEIGLNYYTKSFQLSNYEPNTRYGKHRDSSPLNPNRAITCILYLNPDWEEEHGGHLRIHFEDSELGNTFIDIPPKMGRLLFFFSDIEHEVLTSLHSRYAITLWTYSNQRNQLRTQIQEWYHLKSQDALPDTVFVSIPSYRDPEIHNTVKTIFSNAVFPDRVKVGILFQNDAQDGQSCVLKQRPELGDQTWISQDSRGHDPFYPNLKWSIVSRYIPASDARGPAYARYIILRDLYGNQRYILQIDSHMILCFGWDVYLIRALQWNTHDEGLYKLISYYPPTYSLPEKIQLPPFEPVHMKPSDFDENGILRINSRSVLTNPDEKNSMCLYKHHLIACGFLFGLSERLVPVLLVSFREEYSLGIFYGEEVLASYFLFASGFDIYSIVDPCRPLIFHLWDRTYRKTFWENGELFEDMKARSILGIKNILDGSSVDDRITAIRSLEQFEVAIGVSFQHGIIK